MDVNALFPSKYLKAPDLNGREITVTIERVLSEQVGRTKEACPVVYFIGKKKGFILNRTNARSIAELARSSETNHWIGVSIRLFVTQAEYEGKRRDVIRIKAAP